MPNVKKIRTFDMFCGGGGSSRGAMMAGAVPVAGLDMWDLAAQTYQLNFPEATTYHTKANRLPANRVLKEAGPIAGFRGSGGRFGAKRARKTC